MTFRMTVLVLRNSEYAILKWFAMVEQVENAPGLDLPALDTAAVATGYGVNSTKVEDADALTDALRTAIASPQARAGRGGSGAGHVAVLRGSPMTTAAPDRAPDWVAKGTPEPLRTDLARLVGASAVLGRATDLVRYASDASPYRLIPQVVVQPRDPAGVARVIAYGREHGIPVTFRAGGTSLNGQGQGAGILVDVRRHWRGLEILDDDAIAREGSPRDGARPRQPRSQPPSPKARPRSGFDRHRHGGRGGREQLRRHALRHAVRLVPDGQRHDLHDARAGP